MAVTKQMKLGVLALLSAWLLSGCAVAVKAVATVAGAAVDVTAAGVKAVAGSKKDEKPADGSGG
jgi:hypothetical protein